ncbi:MAG: GH92 family glycosyl hydrolase, partial [Clostridia bacterium]|nr:GH92 family glycosyl hydrolase [Clostridia bacterium]
KTDPAFGKTVVAGYSDYHEKMYVYSVIDAVATGYEIYDRTAILSFAEGTKILTMALATSYISEEQAAKNLSLEIPADADFDSILREAREEWNAVLSTVEVKGASYTELVSLYSSLYRMHCYPYLFSENTGTNEAPVWQYRSPYTNKVADGKMYTTNGFWDTYRAYWPAMSLLSSERDAELLNGILLHYRDKGYIARWLGSAGVTCMMGTHSDIVLADAIIKGLPIDLEAALESMLKNAATANPDDTYGRAENATAPFIGYVPNTHENGLSWTLEDYINDWGIFTLCDHLLKSAKTEEDKARYESLAAYYYNRCLSYADVFNTEVGYFMGKNERGAWTKTKAEFSPYTLDWYADYAETNAWNMAFAITYDIKGLAELYGGEEVLLKKLTTFFSESREKNVYTGGYTYEQRETRLGLSMYNNQVSYHTAYLFSYLGKPSETQRLTREILSRLYVGSEIGQGYPGDEDNGAASAFYVLTALGLYEANIGSGEYLITSPLYQEYTLHLASGDITVKANHNSEENIYIQSCTVNGKAWELPYFTYEMLTSGDLTIVYEMGNTPSEFFAAEKDSLSSLSASKERENTVYRDLLAPTSRHLDREASYLTPTSLTVYTNGITSGKNLWDNNSKTQTVLQNGASVTVAFAKPAKLAFLTVTSASLKQNIASVTLETSKDGKTFTAETLTPTAAWNYYTEPYRIQENEAVYFLRLTFHGADSLALSELEIYGETDTGSTLPPVTDTPDVTDPPSTTQVPTTDETPSTSDPADTIDAPSSGRTVLIILGCVLLGAIGGIALFVLLRKKRNAA